MSDHYIRTNTKVTALKYLLFGGFCREHVTFVVSSMFFKPIFSFFPWCGKWVKCIRTDKTLNLKDVYDVLKREYYEVEYPVKGQIDRCRIHKSNTEFFELLIDDVNQKGIWKELDAENSFNRNLWAGVLA